MPLKPLPWIALLALGACADKDGDDSGNPDDTAATDDTGAEEGHSVAVLATVADDYSVGALATVALDGRAVTDAITDLTGDAGVVVSGGHVFQTNGFGYDNVRIYAPGDWAAPVAEVALDDLANPHDVEVCGGEAFITQYGLDRMVVLDPESGALVGTVDLSAHDDGDGTPESASIVQADNGRLYVGLQRLDRNTDWSSVGGRVVEVDCASKTVTNSWDVDGQATVYPYAPDGSQVVVHSDAGLHLLDTAAGTLSEALLDEVSEGVAVLGFVSWGQDAVVMTLDASGHYGVGCVDLGTWAYTHAETVDNYLSDIAGDDRGEAWIAARTHWSNPAADNGAIVYDIATCAALTTSGPVETLLAPYAIAFY
ncbi:MAG: hypothetical protein H6739_36710 [Alphaproteobacteria bacterium]|nr:hypothetical protein [Alphaproteobacteria bacterium]